MSHTGLGQFMIGLRYTGPRIELPSSLVTSSFTKDYRHLSAAPDNIGSASNTLFPCPANGAGSYPNRIIWHRDSTSSSTTPTIS